MTLSDSWRQYQERFKLDMLKQALQVLTANLHLTKVRAAEGGRAGGGVRPRQERDRR